jgi:hypothetical protein
MKYFETKDDRKLTWKDLKRAHPRIVYYVIFPQGVEQKNKVGTRYSHMIIAKTLKKAIRLYNKYNSPYFERVIRTDLGSWTIREFVRENLSYEELWDKWKDLSIIILGKRKTNGTNI